MKTGLEHVSDDELSRIMTAQYMAWLDTLCEIAGKAMDPEKWEANWARGQTPRQAFKSGPVKHR